MKNLITVELLKLRTYTPFWVMIGLFVLFIPLTFHFFLFLDLNVDGEEIDFFEFFEPGPEALWHYLLFSSSFAVYILVLLILTYTNREVNGGIWRQYLIEGVSRSGLLLAKTAVVLLIALFTTVLVFMAGSILISQRGLSGVMLAGLGEWPFLAGFVLHLAGFMMLAFFLNMIFRSTSIVFLAVFFWGIMLEGVVRWLDPTGLAAYLPVNNFNGLIPNPLGVLMGGEQVSNPGWQAVIMSFLWICVAYLASWFLIRKRDM